MTKNRRKYLRIVLLSWQYGLCFCCGKKIVAHGKTPKKGKWATIEHIIPKSQGGGDEVFNIVITCPACNRDMILWKKMKKSAALRALIIKFIKLRFIEHGEEK